MDPKKLYFGSHHPALRDPKELGQPQSLSKV
jgi:hypothetical protein